MCVCVRYMDAARTLDQETSVGLRRFEVCDNVDLETVLMEYESYYYIKFQKHPKLTKKVLEPGGVTHSHTHTLTHTHTHTGIVVSAVF